MLSGTYAPSEIRFHVRKMTEDRGGRFVEDGVVRVDPRERILYLKRDAPIGYDVVSFNTGSSVDFDAPRPPRSNRCFR